MAFYTFSQASSAFMLPNELYRAMQAGDVSSVRECLKNWPEEADKRQVLNRFLLGVAGIQNSMQNSMQSVPPTQEDRDHHIETGVKYTRMALDMGADIEFHFGASTPKPLATACVYGNLEIVKLLIERGALLQEDRIAPIPLACAMSRNYTEIVDYLLTQPIDLNAGSIPLWFCGFSSPKYLDWMLENGANINAASSIKATALHHWVEAFFEDPEKEGTFEEDHPVLDILLRHGINIWTKDDEGRTAMDIARSYGDNEMVNAILQQSAFHDAISISEKTPPAHSLTRRSVRL